MEKPECGLFIKTPRMTHFSKKTIKVMPDANEVTLKSIDFHFSYFNSQDAVDSG